MDLKKGEITEDITVYRKILNILNTFHKGYKGALYKKYQNQEEYCLKVERVFIGDKKYSRRTDE